MAKSRPNTVAILYCATSGFSPEKEHILECAVIIVDAATFDVITTDSWLVRPPSGTAVPDFHAPLLEECATNPDALRVTQLEGKLMAFPGLTTAGAICSNSLQAFQMPFISKHMPTFAKALKWCLPIDIKSLAFLHAARGGEPYVHEAPKTYRAPDEAIAIYGELCHWTTNK